MELIFNLYKNLPKSYFRMYRIISSPLFLVQLKYEKR